MPSIILSFVGNQDPVSDNTLEEGSIVSLARHLIAEQNILRQVILLYTSGLRGTQDRAELTQEWLMDQPLQIPRDAIKLLPAGESLSYDPINQLLAVQAARQAIEFIRQQRLPEVTLELNGSSGTPAMKSAWSILQATGDARHSRVWQIRNPKEIQLGQARVFRNDINALKNEFDSQVIQQQIKDYNYSGALISLNSSNLENATVAALLESGFYRLSFDFNRAFSSLKTISENIDSQWIQEISKLRQKDAKALLQEIYFNGLIRLKNQRYSDFLVSLFQLQEQLLIYLVGNKLGLPISGERSQISQSWQCIRQVDQGKLYNHLQNYKLPRGGSLELSRSINRYVLLGIIEYYSRFAALVPFLKDLNNYCELRNRLVHGAEGVSEIENEAKLLNTLRKLMKQVTGATNVNPFDRLNQHLCELL